MISSALQQGLTDLVYFTWLHNAEALAYTLGAVLCLGLQFYRPRRVQLLFFVGFVLLLIQFEYVKHIVEPLEQQTLQTVLQQGSQGLRFPKITSFLLQKLIPLGLYGLGWGSVFLGVWVKGSPSKTD